MPGAGDRIAHYRIESSLGAGGMGEVYVAFDEKLERRVALKLLPTTRAQHAGARQRMMREARAASALKHPGIVTVFEIGEAQGLTYIAMELVDGETLAEVLSHRGKLAYPDAVGLLRQIADAITAAHGAGILHRDLKCANLMLDRSGRIKVLDFGLSKRVGAASEPPVTAVQPRRRKPVATETDLSVDPGGATAAAPATDPDVAATVPADAPAALTGNAATPSGELVTEYGTRMGTPGSAAPELMDGLEADVRTDVFSLGVVLYELVTGRSPFSGDSWDDIRARIAERRYTAPSRAGAPDARLDAVIARALAPDRTERYADAAELARAAEDATRTSKRGRILLAALFGAAAIAAIALPMSTGGAAHRAGSAASPLDAAVAPAPPPTPIALTHLGDCAEAPTFVDDRTIVFDRTYGDAVDLYAVGLDGGTPTQLTSGAGWEWRPVPGRSPGTALYLLGDPTGTLGVDGVGVAEIDATTHRSTRLSDAGTSAAVLAAGGDLYYVDDTYTQLHRQRGSADDIALAFPDGVRPQQLAVSPDGARIATVQSGHGHPHKLCIVEVAHPPASLHCLAVEDPENARPAFSVASSDVYYGGAGGIHRVGIDGTGDRVALPGVDPAGGMAISPDGAHLAYSTCDEVAPILDVSRSPPDVAVDEHLALDVATGPNGALAWVRSTPAAAVVMARDPDGRIWQVTPPTLGRAADPSYDPSGRRLAFVISGEHPGIYTLETKPGSESALAQLTDNPNDSRPIWLDHDDLLFTRRDAANLPHVEHFGWSDDAPTAVHLTAAAALDVDRATGEVLIVDPNLANYHWWNPKTGRLVTYTMPPDLHGHVRISPGGTWLAFGAGATGLEIARRRLDRAGAPDEPVFTASTGDTVGVPAIDDDGRVFAAPSRWAGELYLATAPPGARW